MTGWDGIVLIRKTKSVCARAAENTVESKKLVHRVNPAQCIFYVIINYHNYSFRGVVSRYTRHCAKRKKWIKIKLCRAY